ncbi:MAG: hypothetical protein Q7J02_02025 [Rhodocyclaceae bacterium]|nr:hypothetical protein [Rhodocyclaceae bacterium]
MHTKDQTTNPKTPNEPAHDLGQIGEKLKASKLKAKCDIDYPQWVVVENAGTDQEDMWSDHHTLKAARKELKECGGRRNGFDLMKRLPNGMLTTDFKE